MNPNDAARRSYVRFLDPDWYRSWAAGILVLGLIAVQAHSAVVTLAAWKRLTIGNPVLWTATVLCLLPGTMVYAVFRMRRLLGRVPVHAGFTDRDRASLLLEYFVAVAGVVVLTLMYFTTLSRTL
jgi:hypothetical protein